MTQNNFKVKHGLEVPSMDSVYLSDTTTPALRPTLNLDFTKGVDPRITFTRASTATYYDGTSFATGDENLLTYSNDFTQSVWDKTNATITANSVIGPDGVTQNASTLSEDSSNTTHTVSQQAGKIGTITFSCYAKAATRNWISLSLGDGTDNINAWFDLSTQSVYTTVNGTGVLTSATMVDAGNGWWRCVLIGIPSTNSLTIKKSTVGLADAAGSTTYQGTNNYLYIYGAQLESRDVVTPYIATTSTPVSVPFMKLVTAPVDVPRIDYNPITQECNGLFIEKSRTNLLSYSSEFNNAYWTSSNSNVSTNAAIAPDGTLTADRIYENELTGQHRVVLTTPLTVSIGTAYTNSVYAKAAERTKIRLWTVDVSGYINVNLLTGELENYNSISSYSIVNVGNGWWRISVSDVASLTSGYSHIQILNDTGTANYLGDGKSGIYIWGAQLEQELYAGSYIPTTDSQVTTAIDSASISGINFTKVYNQSEGTFVVEGFTNGNGAGDTYLMSVDTSIYTRMSIEFGNSDLSVNAPKSAYFYVRDNAVEQALLYSNQKYNNRESARVVASYKANNFAVATDGTATLTDTSGSVPAATTLYIGRYGANTTMLNGCVKKFQYYPKRLSNESIQSLSTR